MGIFSRNDKRNGRHRGDGRSRDLDEDAAREPVADSTDGVAEEQAPDEDAVAGGEGDGDREEAQAADEEQTGSGRVTRRESGPIDRTDGPFDESEVDGPDGRLDLGSLWLPGRQGMELRVEVDQENQTIVGVTAAVGDSAVQLQAFAAPKSSGLWDDVRGEIAESIVGQGGTAEEVDGQLGAELQTRMPGRGPDGRTVFSPVRFVGVDGPRWFLRGVLSGRAGSDVDAAADLIELVRQTVVVRGGDAMAPRELLELRLPVEVTDDQEGEAAEGAEDSDGDRRDQGDELHPFERGPEITEIR